MALLVVILIAKGLVGNPALEAQIALDDMENLND